ncbi:hypothetical protein GT370_11535 [Acidocella sp. MX-AZ03]|uniref:hypothetical protein n=1 Tax=Acidocella sp. MX-AZ03 TaxID=2697363 RepID=UPI0022DD1D9C|nr:hypothetical protein [Acidocella sp. MX-AZ03]WBO57920.1 hypothetical protein GT370_11535 [Acidocella sp. MX-AZ03]
MQARSRISFAASPARGQSGSKVMPPQAGRSRLAAWAKLAAGKARVRLPWSRSSRSASPIQPASSPAVA